MLTSALLIHLTGGRIETHFHGFGSLAFLAFYRDWKVLVPATLVVAADHGLRRRASSRSRSADAEHGRCGAGPGDQTGSGDRGRAADHAVIARRPRRREEI